MCSVPNRLLIALSGVFAIAACDPADTPAASHESHARTAAALPASSAASRIEVELSAIRNLGDEVQVEVALDRPLPPAGHTRPELQVGDEIVRRSRAGARGRLDRLVFTMPAAQFERMPKDRAMVVRAGVLSNESAEARPQLSDIAVIGGSP